MKRIYYVEDDKAIAGTVREYLEKRGYAVSVYTTLAKARQALEEGVPDLALVDWNMPDGQGDALCRWIRERWRDLPLMFLTVRSDARHVVEGFQNGADDYVSKPFDLEVLESRICALLRRTKQVFGQYLSCGGVSLDQNRRTVWKGKEEVALSPLEYRLLLCLMQNQGRTLTRELLLEQLWDSNGNFVNDNTLTVTMKRLREKLDNPECLKTVRSVGYRMEEVYERGKG